MKMSSKKISLFTKIIESFLSIWIFTRHKLSERTLDSLTVSQSVLVSNDSAFFHIYNRNLWSAVIDIFH